MNKQISLLKTFIKYSLAISFFQLQSCADKKDEALLLTKAQSCLNELGTASVAEAQAKAPQCIAALGNLQTKEAYQLRCAAIFISQGFSSAERLEKIMDQLKNSGSSNNNATLTAIGFMVFSEGGSPLDAAEQAMEYCKKSGSPGMTILASMAKTATVLNSVTSGIDTETSGINTACTSGNSPACLTAVTNACSNLRSNSEAKKSLGQAILDAAALACQGGNSNPMCSIYNHITTNPDPADVGDAFKNSVCSSGS
jgi:hypothetical protein